jgi:hypothetical protein
LASSKEEAAEGTVPSNKSCVWEGGATEEGRSATPSGIRRLNPSSFNFSNFALLNAFSWVYRGRGRGMTRGEKGGETHLVDVVPLFLCKTIVVFISILSLLSFLSMTHISLFTIAFPTSPMEALQQRLQGNTNWFEMIEFQ